jgi:hypothetical protein
MIKNAVIAMLIGVIYFMWIGEFSFLAFISLVTIITFVVWAIEEKINDYKGKLVFQRRIQKRIAQTKISPTAGKAS